MLCGWERAGGGGGGGGTQRSRFTLLVGSGSLRKNKSKNKIRLRSFRAKKKREKKLRGNTVTTQDRWEGFHSSAPSSDPPTLAWSDLYEEEGAGRLGTEPTAREELRPHRKKRRHTMQPDGGVPARWRFF